MRLAGSERCTATFTDESVHNRIRLACPCVGVDVDRATARRLAEKCDAFRVSTEALNVVADPLCRLALIIKTWVEL